MQANVRQGQYQKQLPLVPGYQFPDPTIQAFHKTQLLNVKQGAQTEQTKYYKENIESNLVETVHKKGTPFKYERAQQKTPERMAIPFQAPQWLKYDRQVLRFFGFFQEPVQEMASENFRIRQIVVHYHLDDNTMFINEPKIENSGIPQGAFVKKHKIPLPDGSRTYHWTDLYVGMNLKVYERTYRLTDADAFTKQFYEEQDRKLQEPEQKPEDNFQKTRIMVDFKQIPEEMGEQKEYREVQLGGGHPNRNLHNYLNNDRKVLSFDVLWNDTQPDGGFKFYNLNYYLSDSSMEIKELKQVNTGYYSFPFLLRRQKLSKAPVLVHCPGLNLKKEEFFEPLDLVVGNVIPVYGRDILIYNCDDFTKYWYKEQLGIDIQPISIPVKKEWVPAPKVPPYNGYGTEEDSMGNVTKLLPKPPPVDLKKMYQQDMHILRFTCKLVSSNPQDDERRFVLSFFCGNDNIMVFEIAERNSGRVGGKFLERAKHKNPATATYYQDIDFTIGQTIVIKQYRFLLLMADEYTHTYWDSNINRYPQADPDKIIQKIAKYAASYKNKSEFLVTVLSFIDPNYGKIMPIGVLTEALQKQDIIYRAGVQLTRMEEYNIARKFNVGDFNKKENMISVEQ